MWVAGHCRVSPHTAAEFREAVDEEGDDVSRRLADITRHIPNPDPNPWARVWCSGKPQTGSIVASLAWVRVPLWALVSKKTRSNLTLTLILSRILKMQSSYNSTVAAGILTETALMCSFQPVYWEHSLDGNSTHVFLPTRLLGTITRCVLRLYIQLEAILDSVPAVMA